MIAKTPLYAAFFVFVSVFQNRVSACIKIAIPPLPHVFELRRLQSNPPRSLWLQHIHRMCCLTRRAHTAVPPLRKLEGTHGVRSAWGHTNAIDFVTIASSLHATSGRRAVGNTNRLKAVPPSFVRRLRNNMAQSDGTIVKLGARYGRRLATPIPSSNRHIPCIRTLRIGWNIPQPHQTNKRQRNALL